jgi:hypothetical protein
VPALVIRIVLWTAVVAAALVVALMAWHPWVTFYGIPRS